MATFVWVWIWFLIILQVTPVIHGFAALFAKLPLISRISFFLVACCRAALSISVAVLCLQWLEQKDPMDPFWVLQIICLVGLIDYVAMVLSRRRLLKENVPAMWDVFVRNR